MTPTTPLTSSTRLLTRLASWKIWIASALILVPLAWMFFASSASFAVPEVEAACGQAPPDMRLFTTADGVTQFLDGCGPDGRNAYRNMQLADIFYPTIVGVFLASSLSLAIRRLSPRSGRVLGPRSSARTCGCGGGRGTRGAPRQASSWTRSR